MYSVYKFIIGFYFFISIDIDYVILSICFMLFECNWVIKIDFWFLWLCLWFVVMFVICYFLEVSVRWYGGCFFVVFFVVLLFVIFWFVFKFFGYFKFGGCNEKSVILVFEERLWEIIDIKLFVFKVIFELVLSDVFMIFFMKIFG